MGAGELLIIAVIGLLVLGPERLPVAIRTVSGWVRSAKQMASGITSEINHELKVQELHQNLKKAEEQGLQNLSPELTETVQELKEAAASVNRPYKNASNDPIPAELTQTPEQAPEQSRSSSDPQISISDDNSSNHPSPTSDKS